MGAKQISLYGCYITFPCATSRSQSSLGQTMSQLSMDGSKAAEAAISSVHVHTELHVAVRSVSQPGLLTGIWASADDLSMYIDMARKQRRDDAACISQPGASAAYAVIPRETDTTMHMLTCDAAGSPIRPGPILAVPPQQRP